jgi:hypothetical protein
VVAARVAALLAVLLTVGVVALLAILLVAVTH